MTSAVSCLCGEGASSARVRSVRATDASPTVRVREGALRDGLGTRLWGCTLFLCRTMASMDLEELSSESILELGAGVGLLGCLIASRGAGHVSMTDGEAGALQVARESLALYQSDFVDQDAREGRGESRSDPATLLKDPESLPWETSDGRLCVRRLDWREDRQRMEGEGSESSPHVEVISDASSNNGTENKGEAIGNAPDLHPDATFSLVVGSELLYDVTCAEACAASCALRIAPHGRAHIVGAVREQCYLESFLHQAKRWGLRTCVRSIDPAVVEADADGHTLGLRDASEYEGGYVEIFLDHDESPYAWKEELSFV